MIKKYKKIFIVLIALLLLLQITLKTSNVYATQKANDEIIIENNRVVEGNSFFKKIIKTFQSIFIIKPNNEDSTSSSSAPNPNITPTPSPTSSSTPPNPVVTPTSNTEISTNVHPVYYTLEVIGDWERVGNTFYCYRYTGEEIEPEVRVTKYRWSTIYNQYVISSILKEGTDYELTYSNNINAGLANVNAKGIRYPYTKLDEDHYFYIVGKDINNCTIEFNVSSDDDIIYKETEIRPTVTDKDKLLIENIDYMLEYENVKDLEIGEEKLIITITGEGNYSGSYVKTFLITNEEEAPAQEAPWDEEEEEAPAQEAPWDEEEEEAPAQE
ncbi:MAG: hypothetical protein IKM97_00585, partial [Clostridia bacterium]|nr:hypothetical protein [Clostridia bacterium]